MQNSQTYHYKNLSISYKTVGEGKPLLILHGWGSSGAVMWPLAEQLASIRTCYVLDLPGFGDSSSPGCPWSVSDYVELAAQFIRDNNIEPADLLVHSFGGRMALKLCAQSNTGSLVDKVLITGGAGMKPKRSASYYLKKYTAKLLKAPFWLLPTALREKGLEQLRATAVWKALGSSDYRKLNGVMRETFVKTVSEYLEPCLPQIPHEVLLLWGREDDATPLYQARRMEKGIENAALVVIDNAGHYAFLDRPSHFASIARAFFEG
ncbi:alpha/beta fold hydrolase [Fodinibius sediminis]|uniref:Pimeloyl-ACP methyl ester carboxylesterase n=1 Tax=Fodinibius sediminis TaxID=1214077 RepID=A0A521EDI6_9BACT|nr:alpha/beta hydrolase [Fodinibius sediminis]SMO82007.1 Pimeloyl-ACP methyl ester carboxylesterase [Fodinibius sediminis]